MQAVKLKINITPNHRVYGIVPDDVPLGEAETLVLYGTPSTEEDSGVAHLLRVVENAQKKNYPRRSMDEIMAYIKRERDSWKDES